MSLGFWQIGIIALLVVLLFGRGRISDLMGDVARGIKSFRKGLKDDDFVDLDREGVDLDREGIDVERASAGSVKSVAGDDEIKAG